ncbi:BppU family phage baseplate upper protein [Paenibacillus spongiae]|uniref:BppU family phage baseplate upper protein n=1 Tax=Paenibacillus spongiae TaxID=2909671 RepID=A0ABY5SHI1_9BACL|nr:BppU family phage baseplate upper protein [Paenibacillus spongiae]UVI32103.1 BppU family phage baseplate upper protein [Paenibacillus spongiae]
MTLNIKRNDTRYAINAKLKHPNGSPVDLSDTVVTFTMSNLNNVIKISREAEIIDAENGDVRFSFEHGETNVLGIMKAEFKCEFTDSSIETFPNRGYIVINFEKDLA